MRTLLIGLVAGVAVSQLATLVTTLYLHRALAHRALTLSPGAAWVFRVLTWVTTGIRPRQWVAVHRRHHAFTDVEGDPHSPLLVGFARVQFGNVLLYRRAARDPGTARYARDLPADGWDRWLLDHAVLGLALGTALLVAVLGPVAGAVAAVSHTVGYLLLNSAVNAIGHRFGSRPHDNTATNNQWLAWVTAGEGLHNNHHAAPTSARLAFGRGEIDPAWWVVRLLERRGWASVRHQTPRVKVAAARKAA